MALFGKLLPAGPMLLLLIVLLLFPVPVVVLNTMVPPAVPSATVEDPVMEEFFTMLLDAPLMKRIVLVPAALPVFVFDIVNEFPPEFNPSIVTKFAPFRSTNGAARFPETVRVPEGTVVTDAYDADPLPLAFKTAVAPSTVSPRMKTFIAPW
jgi:hypothetical protein